jgi:hypothetical protein
MQEGLLESIYIMQEKAREGRKDQIVRAPNDLFFNLIRNQTGLLMTMMQCWKMWYQYSSMGSCTMAVKEKLF